MTVKKILARIDRRLEAVKKSADAASKAAGHPDLIRNLRRGKAQTVKLAPMQALARELATTAEWLMDEMGPEEPDVERPTIPVKGHVGAGGVVIPPADQSEIDRIDAPSNAKSNTASVKIVGDSLGRLFDGWFAIYDDSRSPPTEDLIGKLCVLQLDDGRMYIKRLKKGRGKRFTLESNYEAPIENVVVTWAARVKTIIE